MTNPLERGSAPVEFVLVGMLLTLTALSVLQVAFVSHIRAVVIDSAIAGAAHAALADTSDAEGIARTRDLISRGVAAHLVRDVRASADEVNGRDVVDMRVELSIPALGPWVPMVSTAVHGRAFREDP